MKDMAPLSETQKIERLLRRFALGPSEAEVDYYGSGGLAGAIDKLLNQEAIEDNWPFDVRVLANQQGNLPMAVIQSFWYCRLVATNRPLIERLTIFWHDHFATSGAKVTAGPAMHEHIQTLRANALGSFPNLLHAVSKDPAMLFWLDNQENVVGRPNENFAREVMELFTLGIGKYSEQDVQEAARAFTGWTYGRRTPRGVVTPQNTPRGGQYVFNERNHDKGEKRLLGKSGFFNGDQVLDMLCQEPATPRHIVKKMWEWFVYPNPSADLIERLTRRYLQSGMETKALLRAMMESPELYSEEAERGVVKDPVYFCISTLRALGLGQIQVRLMQEAAQQDAQANRGGRPAALGALAMQSTRSMGMHLMMPPDVAGWEIGQGWISSATMIERIKWAESIFGSRTRGGQRFSTLPDREKGQFFFSILDQESDPSKAVDRIISILDARRLVHKRSSFIAAAQEASGGTVATGNCAKVWADVSRLIFGSPEYHFC